MLNLYPYSPGLLYCVAASEINLRYIDIADHGLITTKHMIVWNASTTWWRHQMETFSALLDLCAANSPVTGEFPAQRPVMRSFDVLFFICAWLNRGVNTREAGDLRRHRALYDVIVMILAVSGNCKHMSLIRNYYPFPIYNLKQVIRRG